MRVITAMACLALFVFAATLSGCEEVRVRPEGLDELTDDEVTDDDGQGEPSLGDLSLPEPLRPIAIAAGYYNTCAVLTDGRVACFGDNRAAFEMGDDDADLFVVGGVSDRGGLTLAKHRGCAWSEGGALICWPEGYGRRRAGPVGMPHVKHAAVGGNHTCGVLDDGHVRCLGDDGWLQSNTRFASQAYWVDGVNGVAEVATGATHTCARHEDGSVTCWGDNRRNQMGDGSDRVRALPRPVPGITGATQIASHGFAVQTCVLRGEEGAIACWGSYGVDRAGGTTRLGDQYETLPALEEGRALQIGVGPWEVCAVTDRGSVYCYRQSLASARGGETAVYGEPERIPGITDARAVTVGVIHACALLEEGDVACWGENTHGQLGDGTREERDGPVLATALAGAPAATGDDS